MDRQQREKNGSQMGGFLAGLLAGGLAGAGTMLLLAPQTGKRTRTDIQQKSIELRDQVVKTVHDASAQLRSKARRIANDMHDQAEALGQRGQNVIDEQRDHLSHTLKDWGKAVRT